MANMIGQVKEIINDDRVTAELAQGFLIIGKTIIKERYCVIY